MKTLRGIALCCLLALSVFLVSGPGEAQPSCCAECTSSLRWCYGDCYSNGGNSQCYYICDIYFSSCADDCATRFQQYCLVP